MDSMPTLFETQKELYAYFSKNIKFPEDYRGNELLVASLVVNIDGSVEQVQLLKKSTSNLVNENFIQLLKAMPKWSPAYCNGIQVRSEIKIPLKVRGKD